MAKFKNILSVSINGVELKSLHSTFNKGKIQLIAFDHASLISPLKLTTMESLEETPGDAEADEADSDVFGIDDADAPDPETEEETKSPEETAATDDPPDLSLDMVGDVDETPEEEADSNHDILLGLFSRVNVKKYTQVLNLPSNLVNTVRLTGNYGQMKKREQRKQVLADVQERMQKHVPDENLEYIVTPGGDVFAFIYLGQIPYLEISDEIQKFVKPKFHYSYFVPNSYALANLLFYNYSFDEEEVVALVHIDDHESFYMVVQGNKIIYLSRPISEGLESPGLLNSISGKILYELDLGYFPEISKIIITGAEKAINAKEFLQKTFSGVDVDNLLLNEEKFEVPPENQTDLADYAIPIGLSIPQHLPKQKELNFTNFIPDYVIRRQKVMKLAWHGVLLLLLIFATPMGLDWLNTKKQLEYQSVLNNSKHMDITIQDLEWVVPIVDSLVYAHSESQQKIALLDTLSKGTLRWSVTFGRMYDALQDLKGIWIIDFNSKPVGFELKGVSLNRERISSFIGYFADAEILSVTPSNIRGKVVYNFAINVSSVTDDKTDFNPEAIIPEPRPQEIEPDIVEPLFSEEITDTLVVEDVAPVTVQDTIPEPPAEINVVTETLSESIKPIVVHRVRPGETLKSISINYFGTDARWKEIFEFNGDILDDPDEIDLKQPLVILDDDSVMIVQYTVKAGDDLKLLAEKYYGNEERWEKLHELNEENVPNANIIHVGQVLTIYERESEKPPVVVPEPAPPVKIQAEAVEPEQAEETAETGQKPMVIHKVVTGESLKKIAQHYLGDESRWEEIYRLNQDVIFNIDYIYVGQELRVPDETGVTTKQEQD